MKLEDAVEKAFEEGAMTIDNYRIDDDFINLDCKKDDGSIYQARIMFNDKVFHIDSIYENEEIIRFAEKIRSFL